jgi:DNA-binding response OmpR family regulator
MRPPHILVVEDEIDIARLIKHSLERERQANVDIVTTGDDAIRFLTTKAADLVILDLNLPILDGTQVCRLIRARPATSALPIIMLSARASESDRISGLDLGADDYITKPFSVSELAARVRAVLRRRDGRRSDRTTYAGQRLAVDFDAVTCTVEDQPVRLTRREFELLRYLIDNRPRVLSRDRLLERVWGYDPAIETRSVDVHVGRLRAKLGPAGAQIETVVGIGYRFVE